MLLEGSVRPEERKAALEFYKFLVDRLEVVVSAFTDIQAEAKQAQTLVRFSGPLIRNSPYGLHTNDAIR